MGIKILRLIKIICFIIIIFNFLIPIAVAQKMSIPARIQAAMFSKVFKYDTQLKGKEPIHLLIIFDHKTNSEKDELVKTFESASIVVKTIHDKEIKNKYNITVFDSVDVVYIMPGLEGHSILCKEKKKLSIAGVSKYAEEGHVSITLGLVQDKPRFFISMPSLKGEEHNLSANLLKLSKVYK